MAAHQHYDVSASGLNCLGLRIRWLTPPAAILSGSAHTTTHSLKEEIFIVRKRTDRGPDNVTESNRFDADLTAFVLRSTGATAISSTEVVQSLGAGMGRLCGGNLRAGRLQAVV